MSADVRVPVEERLAVSLLSHNAGGSIDEVLAALQRQSVRPRAALVIDNGSSDDTVERCCAHGVTVRQQSNLGVGAGHAAGLEQLFGDDRIDYVLLIEHDSMLTRTCIENLVEAVDVLETQAIPVGVIACSVVHPVEGAGRIEQVETIASPVALHPARSITFNGLLVSWDAFARVGRPRSDFFVGQEDADLFRRLRRAGVPVRTARYAVVAHSGKGRHRRGESLPALRLGYSMRNTTYRDMYLDRHSVRGSARLGRSMLRMVLRRGGDDATAFDAVRRGFAGRLGPLPPGGHVS